MALSRVGLGCGHISGLLIFSQNFAVKLMMMVMMMMIMNNGRCPLSAVLRSSNVLGQILQ